MVKYFGQYSSIRNRPQLSAQEGLGELVPVVEEDTLQRASVALNEEAVIFLIKTIQVTCNQMRT